MKVSVAVVGGGVAGSTVSRFLAQHFHKSIAVTLFDQGQRGFGGRTSHRRVDISSRAVLPNDDGADEANANVDAFDHGCQFFFSSSPRFQDYVAEWEQLNVVRDWKERRVLWYSVDGSPHSVPSLPPSLLPHTPTFSSSSDQQQQQQQQQQQRKKRDFFGLIENPHKACYVGVGGMHGIAQHQARVAEKHGATLRRGTRVASTVRAARGSGWDLHGVSGQAAFHNTPEAVARAAAPVSLGSFDAVVFTDASCSFTGWHRASAGAADVAPDMAAWIARRPRVPLFTAMLTLPAGSVAADADCIVFESGPVWYACRNNAKLGAASPSDPSHPTAEASSAPRDCWTLISSPEFACQEIAAVPMSIPLAAAGPGSEAREFRPQENDYLNGQGGPADALCRAFLDSTTTPSMPRPPILYLQGQRWGSAIPGSLDARGEGGAAEGEADAVTDIAGTRYQRSVPDLSPRPDALSGPGRGQDFLADDDLGLYYAGDFVSTTRAPGVEAAVLSAEDCARHVAATLLKRAES